jgi:hypothetical protein
MARIPFLRIIEKHNLGIELLARVAGVSPWSVFHMANKDPVEKAIVEQVLSSVTTLTGQVYTLDQIEVVLQEQEQEP